MDHTLLQGPKGPQTAAETRRSFTEAEATKAASAGSARPRSAWLFALKKLGPR